MGLNKRIKELAEQAFIITTEGKIGHVNTYMVEKFAELIVRECVKVVDDTMTENQEMNIGLVMASAQIVAHFGIQE